MHDETKQRDRINQWFNNEYNEAMRSQFPQVKAFAAGRKIGENRSSNKALKNKYILVRKRSKDDLRNIKVIILDIISAHKEKEKIK